MHAVRLLLMGIEILNDGHLTVLRPENQMLLDIRLGRFSLDDVNKLCEKYMEQVEQAYLNSPLPKTPDFHAINKLCVEMHEEFWNQGVSAQYKDKLNLVDPRIIEAAKLLEQSAEPFDRARMFIRKVMGE